MTKVNCTLAALILALMVSLPVTNQTNAQILPPWMDYWYIFNKCYFDGVAYDKAKFNCCTPCEYGPWEEFTHPDGSSTWSRRGWQTCTLYAKDDDGNYQEVESIRKPCGESRSQPPS